jgi:hypothetical protein
VLRRKSPTSTTHPNVHRRDHDSESVADVQVLNGALDQLLEIYPYHDRNLCRQSLLTESNKPLLEAAANALAEANGLPVPVNDRRTLEPWERFRTESYKASVSEQL